MSAEAGHAEEGVTYDDVLEGHLVPGGAKKLTIWLDQGLCAQTDPELFHPKKGGRTTMAEKVCRQCAVIDPCLAYALETGVGGVWGGMSEGKRKTLIRERNKRAAQTPPPPHPSST